MDSVSGTPINNHSGRGPYFIAAAIVVIAAGVVIYWFVFRGVQPPPAPQGTVPASVLPAVQGTLPALAPNNPLENLPEVSPTEQTNPFKNVRTNPFE